MSRITVALGLALLLVEATVASVLVLTSDHVSDVGWTLGLAITAGVTFVLAGLAATILRPENRTGIYLAAVGYLWFLGSLPDSNHPWLFSIGILVGGLAFVPFSALLLTHPTGRFESRLERAFPVVVGLTLLLLATGIVLVDATPLPACERCPENALLVVDSPRAAGAMQALATAAAIALALGGVVLLGRRWRRATPVLRRLLLPVFAAGGGVLVTLVVEGLLAELVSTEAADAFAPVVFATFALVPVAFLFGILRTRLAGASVSEIVAALQGGTPLRDALAEALGDPSLEIVYRVDWRRGAGWVDERGRSVPEPAPRRTRAVRFVERDGEAIAALLHDPALDAESARVDLVTTAAGLALQNERLQAELRAEVAFIWTVTGTAPSLLVNLAPDGRIRNVNNAALVAAGAADEDAVVGSYFWDVFIDDEESEAMQARFAAAAPDFPPAEYENTFTNARGERRTIYWRSAPVLDERSRVVSIVAGGLDITERHRLEEEKEREREFLNAIANNAPSLLCLIDDEGRVTDRGTNIAFERALGYDPAETGGAVFWERYVEPEEANEVRDLIGRVVDGEEPHEHDHRWVASDDRRLLIAWTCTPLPRVDERRLFLISGVDVTERQEREQEAERRRDFLNAITEAVPSFLVAVDPDAIVLEDGSNRAFREVFGWTEEETVGQSFLGLIAREDDHTARIAIANAANGVAQAEQESVWLTRTGEARIVAWTARPVMDPQGRRIVLVSGSDVTLRRHREEETRASEERFRAVIDRSPVAILEVDLDLEVKLWNPAAERIFGWKPEEVLGRPVPIIPEDREEEFRSLLAGILGGEAFRTLETVRLRRDGSRVDVEVSAAPIRDAAGQVAGYMAVFGDISERKGQEEELRASRARIVAAGDDARRKLERNLHDGAQQRLVALSVSLRLAESKLHDDPAAAAVMLAAAREELMHALEELRELARGIHPAILTDRGLQPAIEALVGRTPLPVDMEVSGERLPPAVEAASYYVVAEALTNVAKYAGASSARVRVGREDGRVVIEVADDGAGGADPEHGSGLRGLADRIAALDGILFVESPRGQGTSVRAEIPLVDVLAGE